MVSYAFLCIYMLQIFLLGSSEIAGLPHYEPVLLRNRQEEKKETTANSPTTKASVLSKILERLDKLEKGIQQNRKAIDLKGTAGHPHFEPVLIRNRRDDLPEKKKEATKNSPTTINPVLSKILEKLDRVEEEVQQNRQAIYLKGTSTSSSQTTVSTIIKQSPTPPNNQDIGVQVLNLVNREIEMLINLTFAVENLRKISDCSAKPTTASVHEIVVTEKSTQTTPDEDDRSHVNTTIPNPTDAKPEPPKLNKTTTVKPKSSSNEPTDTSAKKEQAPSPGASPSSVIVYTFGAMILLLLIFIIYQNSKKIKAMLCEKTNGEDRSNIHYERLKKADDESLPKLEKSTLKSNFIY